MKFLTKSLTDNGVSFILANGKKITTDLDDYPEEIRVRLALHGLAQKIGDGTSGFSKSDDYVGAFAEMTAINDGLLSGDWNRKGGGTGVTDLATVLAELTGKDVIEADTVIRAMDDDKLKALKADARVKAGLARLRLERAERAAKNADGDALDDLFADS